MRENRYKYLGLVFLLVFLLIVILGSVEGYTTLQSFPNNLLKNNNDGQSFPCNLSENHNDGFNFNLLISVIALVIPIFLSEGLGYLINSVFMSSWDLLFGYEKILEPKLRENLHYLKKCYNDMPDPKFEQLLKNEKFEPKFNFCWMRAPDGILKWVERRWDVYFANYAIIFTIILSSVFSLLAISYFKFEPKCCPLCVFAVIFLVVSLILHRHAEKVKDENIRMMNIWLQNLIIETNKSK